MPEQTYVIIGGGLTGATAATTIREGGFEGRVILVAAEDELPYTRPPLSKEYLAGAAERDSVFVHDAAWYRDNNVELLEGRQASRLSVGERTVTLDDGQGIRYDKLLLATGASPRRYPGPGADLRGVHHLRTISDSEALKRDVSGGGRRVVIVGSGWIGLEVASAARKYGNSVTVLGRERVPLSAAIGEQLGMVFAEVQRENGVDVRMLTRVEVIEGDAAGAVTGVRLEGGEIVPADVVVVGIGAIPNIDLARDAGLTIDNGILTDESFQTSEPLVYAAGDVANVLHPVLGQHIRIEHWANALNAGAAVGRSLLGEPVSYREIPYFYTDQFEVGMEYSGYAPLAADAEILIRGDLASREFVAFWVREGRVVAGMNVNVWDVNETVQQLIRSGTIVNRERLTDSGTPLADLLPET